MVAGMTTESQDVNPADSLMAMDQPTRDSIAHALWQRELDPAAIPEGVLAKLADPKNSPAAHADRMRRFLRYLKDHPLSHTPDLSKTYDRLLEHCQEGLSPQQAYAWQTAFLGPSATVGYDMIPLDADLAFPADHLPKFRSQVGWHFFVGSCWDTEGNEYGAELMFFGTALFPPNVAAGLGLSDEENQIIELQLAISERGGRHYQAEPVVLAGTSGLLGFTADPMVFRLGRNSIECHNSDGLFPVTIKGWGVDKGSDPGVELGLDITFTSGKETLLQGDQGCMPSIDGVGSLYYSIPDLQLDPSCSTLTLDGRTIDLARGQFWFDHQWGYLTGAAASPVMRAAAWATDPNPSGWDWFMTHLTDDRQITMFAPHSKALADFYEQTGDTPPPTMRVQIKGTMMAADRTTSMVVGTLSVTDWIKAEHSPNPDRYLVTDTWYPNRWNFVFDEDVPEDIREFTLTPIVDQAQAGFFANGAQYAEGAVVVTAPDGTELGRGFAESVSFADTRRTTHRLAGLPETDAEIKAMSLRKTPKALALVNAAFVLTHQADLKAILAEARAMDFFAPPEVPKGDEG
jgi:predicted secreted hydrolase